jgi:hypothetical protein
MVTIGLTSKISEITTQLNRTINREWVFPACARYGELLAALKLEPRAEVEWGEIQPQISKLIKAKLPDLASSWEQECKHINQMVRSGNALTYEELVALLTSLSELTFTKICLNSVGSIDLSWIEVPAQSEIREFLIAQRDVYPPRWSLPHTIVLECKDHWWWKKP